MLYRLLFILILVIQTASARSQEQLHGSALHPFGRYWRTGDQLELTGPASHFGFRMTGTEFKLYAFSRGTHDYLQVEVDGEYRGELIIQDSVHAANTFRTGSPGPHTIWVYRETEAIAGPVIIQTITGTGLHALQRPDAPLIEFIGNSITCGAAADSSKYPCRSGGYFDHSNAYYAYGPRVARALKANYILSSVSGIGIYRNWNSDGPTMPQVYASADFRDNTDRPWDFTAYHPRVVSIALGTNDLSHGDGHTPRQPFDSNTFINAYVKFIGVVKSHYPHARIALLSSPMVRDNDRILLQSCLSSVKSRVDALYPLDKPVALHFFKPMVAGGCGGHPSVEDHGLLAGELLPFFRGLLRSSE